MMKLVVILSVILEVKGWIGIPSVVVVKSNKTPIFVNSYFSRLPIQSRQVQGLLHQVSSSDDTSDVSSSSTTSFNNILADITDKIIYQRAFYSYTPGSDVAIHKSIVIEERVRFQADPDRDGYIQPIGPRTLILRDGNVDDGEIGNDFFTINVVTGTAAKTKHHNGIGNDSTIETTIATALYLASNPTLCTGQVLQIACENGLAGLLGCIGAAYVNGDFQKMKDGLNDDDDVDVLTISKKGDPIVPMDMELLTLSDDDVNNLEVAMTHCRQAGIKRSAIVEQLEWRKRPQVQPRGMSRQQQQHQLPREYDTIIASDVAYSFPESKELARTVANRLKSLRIYDTTKRTQSSIPTFVHICPEHRVDVKYLRTFLDKGYKMSIRTGYLKVEQLKFMYQKLNTNDAMSSNETKVLDEMELELIEYNELPYQCIAATHHPNYAGAGSGELFFPLETGEYDSNGGTTYLERETGSNPW